MMIHSRFQRKELSVSGKDYELTIVPVVYLILGIHGNKSGGGGIKKIIINFFFFL
jgi:hypothetical protein